MKKIPDDAFTRYMALGVGRSYQTLATQLGCSKRAVTRRATEEGWQKRAAELEAKAKQNAEQRTLETIDEMHDRHLRMLRIVQTKALEALRRMPLTNAFEAIRALGMSIKEERCARGEPTERTDMTIEQIIKDEYSRWLVRDDGDDPKA